MKRRGPGLVLAGVLMAILLLPLPSLSAGTARRFSFEILGGWARAGLDDVNVYPAYYEGYTDYYFARKYAAIKARKGGFFSFAESERTEGGFERLRNLFPAGLRAAWDIGYGWSALLGLEYLSGRMDSSFRVAYDISDFDPDKFFRVDASRVEMDFPNYRLAVKAWIPTLGARYRVRLGRRLDLEAFASFGWMEASFKWDVEYATTTTYDKGFWSRSRTNSTASGSGSGLVGEAGGVLKIGLSGHLSAFLEGVYAYRRTSHVWGDSTSRTVRDDPNSAPYITGYSEESGVFRVREYNVSTYGDYTYEFPVLVESTSVMGGSLFRIDLTGCEIRAGLSWRL